MQTELHWTYSDFFMFNFECWSILHARLSSHWHYLLLWALKFKFLIIKYCKYPKHSSILFTVCTAKVLLWILVDVIFLILNKLTDPKGWNIGAKYPKKYYYILDRQSHLNYVTRILIKCAGVLPVILNSWFAAE